VRDIPDRRVRHQLGRIDLRIHGILHSC
jgi:hypothetical protein